MSYFVEKVRIPVSWQSALTIGKKWQGLKILYHSLMVFGHLFQTFDFSDTFASHLLTIKDDQVEDFRTFEIALKINYAVFKNIQSSLWNYHTTTTNNNNLGRRRNDVNLDQFPGPRDVRVVLICFILMVATGP